MALQVLDKMYENLREELGEPTTNPFPKGTVVWVHSGGSSANFLALIHTFIDPSNVIVSICGDGGELKMSSSPSVDLTQSNIVETRSGDSSSS